MATSESVTVYSGLLANPTKNRNVELKKCVIGVDRTGKIKFLEQEAYLEKLKHRETSYQYEEEDHISAQPGEMWIPGLVDTHTHASQYPNLGLGLDLPLLPWLNKYTFPLEAKFADPDYAADVYQQVVSHLLQSGTTTVAYHATIHQEATRRLFTTCQQLGQRAVVGKISMTRNGSTELNYQETPEESFRSCEEFLLWSSKQNEHSDLVLPSVTPRFAVTSYHDCLLKLGELANRFNCHVQTHISENKNEIELVQEQFPDSDHYAGVYDTAGLMNQRTVLAHGVHLTNAELDLIKIRGSGVSHCPRSNGMLSSGMCNVRKLLNRGIKVGLGTDMSGGFSHSMLDAVRQAVETSKHLAVSDPHHGDPLTTAEAFWLATLGGAQVLDMDDKIGSFEVGKHFDAVLISGKRLLMAKEVFSLDDEELFNKIIYLSDDRDVKSVFVDGADVLSRQ